MTDNETRVTVKQSASLKRAMSTIDQNTLGIVFVVDEEERLLGTATDGDIRRGILSGVDVDASITEVINEDPIVIYDSWSDEKIFEEVNELKKSGFLSQHRDLTVPVLDDRDVVRGYTHVSGDGTLTNRRAESSNSVDTVLVVGGAGYIGSVLCEMLLARGHTVRALDNHLYGDQGVARLFDDEGFSLIEGDMRSIETVMDAIQDVDAVVHLGALVGDPASSIDTQKTLELNYHSVKMVAEICKYHQINRFIFASTCSVYGVEQADTLLDETSPLNPVSLYAKSKIESEDALLDMEDGNFSPTILRKATVYGLSPRMRFDLVVNVLTAKAHDEGTIPIFGGKQYRPNIHVRDAARAYIDCLEAPIDDVAGEVFNVGSNEQNYRIEEIGEIVAECFPDAGIDFQRDKEDERSYKVDFSKIESAIGFEVEHSVRDGCLEIKNALEAGKFPDYSDQAYSNYRTLENSMDILRAD